MRKPLCKFQSSPNPKVGCHSNSRQTAGARSCFNPHPTRRLGAISTMGRFCFGRQGFNPHPTRRLGAMVVLPLGLRQPLLFQSSPNPKVGCHPLPLGTFSTMSYVSILTQPEGWVPWYAGLLSAKVAGVSILTQPEGWVPCQFLFFLSNDSLFQSSPNPKVGCHRNPPAAPPRNPGFQSSPNPKVGCHNWHSSIGLENTVSILTQPEGWVPSGDELVFEVAKLVSILTQPEGWVPSRGKLGSELQERFQSSPNPKVGCHIYFPFSLVNDELFQSSPNPKVGCHKTFLRWCPYSASVSILTQPEGWVPSVQS